MTDQDLADELYAAIGFRITRLRRARGLVQGDVARAVGLSRTAITNAESGRQRLPLHTLLAIAQTLGATLSELLDTGRDLPSLADELPESASSAIADAADEIDRMRKVIDRLADALKPFITEGRP